MESLTLFRITNTSLDKNGYYQFLTAEEKQLFNTEVGTDSLTEIMPKQLEHEAIEPILWTLGFVDNLSSYNNFVITDFHPILDIGKQHSIDDLIRRARLQKAEE